MARPNDDVADLLFEYADLISITGGDAFKARVYEKAARAVAGFHDNVADLDQRGVERIPGVGRSIAAKIVEYMTTGRVAAIEELRAGIPDGVRRLTAVPGLGPKRALQLYRELGISSIDDLAAAIQAGQLRELKGLGEKSEAKLLHGIDLLRSTGGRSKLHVAEELARRLVATIATVDGCQRCAYAGSLRRMRETIGDVDILAAADRSAPLMEALVAQPDVAEVVARGETKTSVRTVAGVHVDLRVVPLAAWGAAMQYFTGSAAHNVRIRELAVRAGLKLSEYGLFDAGTGELLVSETEAEVYERLGLPWIPPELREDRGEIEAALRGDLPDVIAADALRGDLHTHTNLTDGQASAEDMVATAAARGYEYYAITDHAPDLYMQRMSDEKMLAQRTRAHALDGAYSGMRVLHGTELNIGPDGEVDWPAEFLAGFDVCVASVHSHFTQSSDDMTRRLIRACENPHVHIIGHLTGRKIGRRAPIDADLDAVFAACARTGTALEINSHPDRLDLHDEHILRARRHGVKFAINSDAHSTIHLPYVRYGVGMARRGWLTGADVINTWPLERLRSFLAV
ncbi:DNA polymerase/3'-5' exonuclease PolX [Phytoactinopolyspora limicola]|uniref:DNA polymerase/3'-5' exonuclease PolX n=1 Tax=Phytoactinopolyspora limicola TaxID=2715536 RepID=UPI00140A2295|nr:DNA polymerase/3'-5' exonuclease PolX [Phytoactinopolyspora limicola]